MLASSHMRLSRLPCHTSKRCLAVRAQAAPSAPAPAAGKASTRQHAQEGKDDGQPFINLIPNNGRWEGGIPPVMGAHLMASGVVSPVSVSKGAGIDVTPHPFQYHDTDTDVTVLLYVTAEKAQAGLAKLVVEAAQAAVKAKGAFTLVLSGGSLPSLLAPLATAKGIDWAKTHVFFVDERNVPHSSPDSTYKAAQEELLSKVPVPPAQVYAIAEGLPVEQAAIQYEGRLISVPAAALPRSAEGGFPVFDLILLGLGPDGHVASLFPNRGETAVTSGWILPVKNSPKPPPERITMTLPVINAAKEVAFVALGAGKAEIVQRTLEVQALPGALPAQLVRPRGGKLKWLLDVPSAEHLDVASWGEGKQWPRSTF
ncbi:putative 6-phosphogluconolactonase 5, chloroplastic [Tetrabaena socialis]|uniref:6-phosphogluconolactonase n=1 Tax=Tetrabaena socialis TaxID=47790 RepID=A0A2J8AE41_9CHLO|nr:putative 6-phosphogluconolactonase 5, chloroplastic [Tetrabaena socialis]|eukprot:PNH10783.1 putative 6-phosphogluconolactonase 5, chloroplastic [Tetrabaena socialis]